jgi:hypothetical protein
MPKSAKDELIGRIDADVARLGAIRGYVASVNPPRTAGEPVTASDVMASVDGELRRLEDMRDYVTAQVPKAAATEPKKRGRKRKGLPADTPSNGD